MGFIPSVSFSLSEPVIIDPILTLRAPLPPPVLDEEIECTALIWQFVQSEVIARIVAIFTSVIAAADACIHLLTGIYKGICGSPEAYDHLQSAAWFVLLAAIGSIAGVIWPDLLAHFRYFPSLPDEHDPLNLNVPPALRELADGVIDNRIQPPFAPLQTFWNSNGRSLEDKYWFARIFSYDSWPQFATVRTSLANVVYRPIIRGLHQRQIQWLSNQEVNSKIQDMFGRINSQNQGFYFHATPTENALQSILTSRRVEVRHEKAFKGAFVSTVPEKGFGRYILVFNRSIERLSPLNHGFTINQHTYWAGFRHDIPVTASTLAYIMLDEGDNEEVRGLQDRVRQWTGNNAVTVISLNDVAHKLDKIRGLDMGIPSEWPGTDDDNGIGQPILNTLRARATAAAMALRIQQQRAVAQLPQQQHAVVRQRVQGRQQPLAMFA